MDLGNRRVVWRENRFGRAQLPALPPNPALALAEAVVPQRTRPFARAAGLRCSRRQTTSSARSGVLHLVVRGAEGLSRRLEGLGVAAGVCRARLTIHSGSAWLFYSLSSRYIASHIAAVRRRPILRANKCIQEGCPFLFPQCQWPSDKAIQRYNPSTSTVDLKSAAHD